LIILAAYTWHKRSSPPVIATGERHNEVIMYSLTTCGHCKTMARQLNDAGIAFSERVIDRDAGARKELTDKLERAGLEPRGYGAPIMDIRGTLLLNNPGLAVVKKHL
jgi:glutaredoxin